MRYTLTVDRPLPVAENTRAPMNCRRCTYYYEERGRIGAIPEYGHCMYAMRQKVPYWVNQGPQLTYADELGCDTWTLNVLETYIT